MAKPSALRGEIWDELEVCGQVLRGFLHAVAALTLCTDGCLAPSLAFREEHSQRSRVHGFGMSTLFTQAFAINESGECAQSEAIGALPCCSLLVCQRSSVNTLCFELKTFSFTFSRTHPTEVGSWAVPSCCLN